MDQEIKDLEFITINKNLTSYWFYKVEGIFKIGHKKSNECLICGYPKEATIKKLKKLKLESFLKKAPCTIKFH